MTQIINRGVERLKDVRPSSYAWLGVIGSIAVYDLLCPENEQMSERADEWMEHPLKRRALELGMAAIALHVCNAIKPEIDPIHRLATLHRKANIS